ncbi:MAG: hypothetical protein WAW00_03475, partial [Candidatus Moraniibacteriota bacterium]
MAIVSLLLLFYVAGTVQAATGINEQINFQGKVVNTDGTNVSTASYTFLFCIYTTASPTTACTSGADNDAIWRESKSITVTDGIFQTNLGDTTTLPGAVDFNTDNIYLGINFNANGQMTPLVRFTAAPYALNAAKVGGLTVTDTTGTLTIPSGKTISFADAFTTSGAFATTLTVTGTTNATIPAGTVTLADLTTGQTLTNKIIGSTGLTFTGATTDITTGTGEDLTITANGAGIISLSDATTIVGTTNINATGTAATTIGNGTGTLTLHGATTLDNTFTVSGTNATSLGGTLGVTGLLTASGGINLSASQSLAAAALSYVDLGLITHSTTANQGLRLPNAASATPSNPTSGEGYLAWDAAGNQLITYNGSSWTTLSGGSGISTVRESDTSPSVGSLSTLEFGPASTSSEEFIVTDQTGGVARVIIGTQVAKLNEAETVTGGWTFNTLATTFTTAIDVNAASTIAGLTVDGSGNLTVSDGLTSLASSATTASTKALSVSQTGATTGTDYGAYVTNTGAATTNVGVYASATGATNNYAAVFENGSVGIGTATPTAKLNVKGTADATQVIVQANATQANTNPLLVLANSSGTPLTALHSDNATNSFIGINAGRSNAVGGGEAGQYNLFIGPNSGYSNAGGSSNTAIGTDALYTNTAGTYNFALGRGALYWNSGNYNTAIGATSLFYNDTGTNNTGVGTDTLVSNGTGGYNTAVGMGAGYGTASGNYSNNTLLGYRAGYVLNTAGNNNILVGYQAGNAVTTGANNIIIGYDVDAPVATSSSQLSIGNLIFATGGFGTGTTLGAGSIGIGDASPDAKLDVDSVQTSGTVSGILDSTAIVGAIVGQSITLSGTGAFDQTGLQFNLSNA